MHIRQAMQPLNSQRVPDHDDDDDVTRESLNKIMLAFKHYSWSELPNFPAAEVFSSICFIQRKRHWALNWKCDKSHAV